MGLFVMLISLTGLFIANGINAVYNYKIKNYKVAIFLAFSCGVLFCALTSIIVIKYLK